MSKQQEPATDAYAHAAWTVGEHISVMLRLLPKIPDSNPLKAPATALVETVRNLIGAQLDVVAMMSEDVRNAKVETEHWATTFGDQFKHLGHDGCPQCNPAGFEDATSGKES